MNNESKEIRYGPVEPIEFEEKQSEVKVAPRRIKLDKDECGQNRLATMKRDIPFTDYSSGTPEQLIYEAEMNSVPMTDRNALLRKCTKQDRAGIPEIDWERFDDLLTAKVFGFTEGDWNDFKKSHPIGLYNKLMLVAKEVNGELTLTKKQLETLKNLEGQEQ